MKSAEIKAITEALAKAQIAFLPIKKTESVDYQTTAGRKKYAYAPLDEVIEATKKGLSDNQLAITQTTYLQGGGVILETLLCHSSGEWLSGELYVGRQDAAPQSLGSSLTYMRRYGISAILGVASEADDDAAREDKAPREKPIAKKPAQAPTSTLASGINKGIEEGNRTELSEEAGEPSLQTDKVGREWLKETLQIIKWSDKTCLSWIKTQLKVEGKDLMEVLNSLDTDKLKVFVTHIRSMRESAGL